MCVLVGVWLYECVYVDKRVGWCAGIFAYECACVNYLLSAFLGWCGII